MRPLVARHRAFSGAGTMRLDPAAENDTPIISTIPDA
jgi:hypothetical protein